MEQQPPAWAGSGDGRARRAPPRDRALTAEPVERPCRVPNMPLPPPGQTCAAATSAHRWRQGTRARACRRTRLNVKRDALRPPQGDGRIRQQRLIDGRARDRPKAAFDAPAQKVSGPRQVGPRCGRADRQAEPRRDVTCDANQRLTRWLRATAVPGWVGVVAGRCCWQRCRPSLQGSALPKWPLRGLSRRRPRRRSARLRRPFPPDASPEEIIAGVADVRTSRFIVESSARLLGNGSVASHDRSDTRGSGWLR